MKFITNFYQIERFQPIDALNNMIILLVMSDPKYLIGRREVMPLATPGHGCRCLLGYIPAIRVCGMAPSPRRLPPTRGDWLPW